MIAIGGKLVVGLVCMAMAFAAVQSEWLNRLPSKSFANCMLAATLLTRLTIFVLLYLVLGYEVPSDVPAAYYPEAKAALAGKLVYRDFFSTYAPLFPYICAIPVMLWNSTKSVVLFAILVEAIAIPLWLRVLAVEFSEQVVRIAAILYTFSPLLISTVAMAGQNHVWISPFLAVAIWFLQKKRDTLGGVAFGLCLVSTKFLAIIFLPVTFLFASRKTRFLSGFAVIVGTLYGALFIKGADILAPLKFQRSVGQESSGNLPYLASLFGVAATSPLYVVGGVLTVGAICSLLWIERARISRRLLISTGITLLFALVMLFSKKSFTPYWASCFFPLCAFWAYNVGKRLVALLGLLGWCVIATLEPTLYFRWIDGKPFQTVATLALGHAVVFLTCQLILFAFSIVIIAKALRDLREIVRIPARETTAPLLRHDA